MVLLQKRLKFEAATLSVTTSDRQTSNSRYPNAIAVSERALFKPNKNPKKQALTSESFPFRLQQTRTLTYQDSRGSLTWKQRLQHTLALSLLLGILPLVFSENRAMANTNAVLSDREISEKLEQLPGWTLQGNEIVNTFEFPDFVAAVDFVNQLVAPAESANHHPDLAIAYNKVTVSLTTHDAGGITERDFALAKTISQLAAE